MSTNPTHRTRLARALADTDPAGISYQKALSLVTEAAEAGALPGRLDADGMREALQTLLRRNADGAGGGVRAGNLEARYYRLREVSRLRPGVPQRVARAEAAGVPGLRRWGDFDPRGLGDDDGIVTLGGGRGSDWWARVAAAGPRPDCIMPDPYEGRYDSDGGVPLDRAMGQRDATGDVRRYAAELERIVRSEPRDVDAWAHLGNHYLTLAENPVRLRPPGTLAGGERAVRDYLQKALGYYQAGVGVAELALPDPFRGFLFWGHLDNRPLGRALHGTAVALWALGRFEEAERVLLNMLWLDPRDTGAGSVLAAVRARQPWADPPGAGGLPGRIEAWAGTWNSADWEQAVAAIKDRLLQAAPPPGNDGAGPLPRWQWLLDRFGEGVPLTQTGNLNRAFVQENADRFGWDLGPRPPCTEHDVMDLHQLRALATGLGLARPSGRKMTLTPEGRRLASDPAALWQATARSLVSDDDEFTACTGEMFLVFLLHGETVSRDELARILARSVTEAGFRTAGYGDPPDQHDTMWAAHRTINRLRALGLLDSTWTDRFYRLTAAGAAAAIEALRARAGFPPCEARAEAESPLQLAGTVAE